MLYFAYGSNLLTRRLLARAPSARKHGVAVLRGYGLRFHKRARDASAKCNTVPTGNADDVVHGALFEIDSGDWDSLDRAEGRGAGYEREVLQVEPAGDRSPEHAALVAAQIYLARPEYVDATLLPYGWYRDLVVAGAREHSLPADYIARLEGQPVMQDPDAEREARERGFLCP